MSGETTLEEWDLQITNSKIADIENKLHIASNVLTKCEENAKIGSKPRRFSTPVEKCCDLTGVPKTALINAMTCQQKTKNFAEWLTEQKLIISRHMKLHSYNDDYESLKKRLVEYYSKKLEVPLEAAPYLKNDFTFVRLPGTKSSIIVEKPEFVQERHTFLYTKMKYCDEKKHIVYIGKINISMRKGEISYAIEEDNPERCRFIVAVSPTIGHIAYIYCFGTSQEYINNWIEEKVIPNLPEKSVIIFQENMSNNMNETIDSFSTKEHMVNWLEFNKINHDPNMHRADLYKFIRTLGETYGDRHSPAEDTLIAHGHIVIQKKRCNLNINYFDPFWDLLLQRINAEISIHTNGLRNDTHIIQQTMAEIVQNAPLDYWKSLDIILLEKEREIYKEDLEMEEVIDKLMIMVKYDGLSKEVKLSDYNKTTEQSPIYFGYVLP